MLLAFDEAWGKKQPKRRLNSGIVGRLLAATWKLEALRTGGETMMA